MAESVEERRQRDTDAILEAQKETQDQIDENGSQVEPYEEEEGVLTPENYKEHVANVPGIFGDTPTDPTIGDVQVPTKNEEAAGVAVAENDADAEEGDEEAAEASDAEAKRQVDAAGPTSDFAEEVDEAADDESEDEDSDDESDDSEEDESAA